ncbi:breast carcinoma-amplified sequence 1 isoform X10 [Hippopotamus amphibius kiboko]|uniref:breast carcinoma-amplified sequence 1 isoform X10 n=1 Tax=Hippopotamus amphibius kiboko TaxID=575201 RepID=UPI0025979C5C|nr:breast carcinoma-amplified sequence 1 isoform X10 [Hippopotamus amphibius kiboko]
MGNQMSVPQRVEDQETDSEADAHKVAPGDMCGQNGMPGTHPVQLCEEVDLEISVQEENVATSSLRTMEISATADANGKNLGKEAKARAPAAKSRFFLTLSRPVPGRTADQATDSSTASVKLDVSSDKALGNKDPSEPMALPVAAAPGRDPDKTPGPTPAQPEGLSATWGPEPRPPESGGEAPSKPKDAGFFDRLFKLDKGRDKAPVDRQREAESAEHPHPAAESPGFATQSDDVPAERDVADGKEEGQEIPSVSCSVPGDPEVLEVAKEDPQTENNSIMSFFKTLVSPNKAETKKDLEDTGTEKSPTTSADLKSDKANVTPQEPQGAAKNSTSTETAKEGVKEKGGPTSLPLGKLFWKKTSESTEKAVVPPEPEPAAAGQKGKEGSSKDKKVAAETSKQKSSKQEVKEPAPSPEPALVEANSLQNGDKSQKRPEKRRQSLGGFFKGLGPKRMLDAQVQTDPVSIGPVGKSK